MCETHACVRHRHVSDTRMYARRHVAKWHVPTCTNMSQHVNDEGGHQEIVVGVLVACRVWARHMEDSERDKRGPGGGASRQSPGMPGFVASLGPQVAKPMIQFFHPSPHALPVCGKRHVIHSRQCLFQPHNEGPLQSSDMRFPQPFSLIRRQHISTCVISRVLAKEGPCLFPMLP